MKTQRRFFLTKESFLKSWDSIPFRISLKTQAKTVQPYRKISKVEESYMITWLMRRWQILCWVVFGHMGEFCLPTTNAREIVLQVKGRKFITIILKCLKSMRTFVFEKQNIIEHGKLYWRHFWEAPHIWRLTRANVLSFPRHRCVPRRNVTFILSVKVGKF